MARVVTRWCRTIAAALGLGVGVASAGDVVRLSDVPLPGPAGRFDYAAQDPRTGFLWLNQMGTDRTLVFDPKTRRVAGIVPGMAMPTGITLAPRRRLAFISNAGDRYTRVAGHGRVAVVNLDTMKVLGRLPAGHFPDGSVWVSDVGRLFVSDELGGTETVIGGKFLRTQRSIALGGEAGMSAYDPIGRRVLVNVQTRRQIVAIDTRTLKIVARTTLPPTCRHNHGLLVDAGARLAFVACDGDARLLVLSLPELTSVQSPLALGEGPDVLALDAARSHLVVAAESGVGVVFAIEDGRLKPVWRGFIGPNAHVVVVDAATGDLYLPLKALDGHPTLRIMRWR